MAHWASDPFEQNQAATRADRIRRLTHRFAYKTAGSLKRVNDNLKAERQGGKDQKLTTNQYQHIVDQYGSAAAERALYSFAKKDKKGTAKGMKKHGFGVESLSEFLITRGDTSKYSLNPGASFNNISQTAAIIQANIAGLNYTTDEEARAAAQGSSAAALADTKVSRSTQNLASQKQRAGKAASGQAFKAATTGLFDPSHLARQQLNSGSLSGSI